MITILFIVDAKVLIGFVANTPQQCRIDTTAKCET